MSFFLVNTAGQAAMLAPNAKVLNNPPLQPPPTGAAPNYQNNINNISNPDVLPGQNEGSETSGAVNPAEQSFGAGAANRSAAATGGVGKFASQNKTLALVLVCALFLIGAGIYWRFKKKNGQE